MVPRELVTTVLRNLHRPSPTYLRSLQGFKGLSKAQKCLPFCLPLMALPLGAGQVTIPPRWIYIGMVRHFEGF